VLMRTAVTKVYLQLIKRLELLPWYRLPVDKFYVL